MILSSYLISQAVCENEQRKSKKQEKSKESVNTQILSNPDNRLTNSKLASILENFYLEKISEEITKYLPQKYKKPENCSKMKVPQYNPETWKMNLSSFQRSTNITLRKILLVLIKLHMLMLIHVMSLYWMRKLGDQMNCFLCLLTLWYFWGY